MARVVMGAVVSLDGFMADEHDGVGPLFDWLGNGPVAWSFPGSDDESQTTQASADFMLGQYGDVACVVIGRRLLDLTNGWEGKPAAGEHVLRHRGARRAPSTGEPECRRPWRPGHPHAVRCQPLTWPGRDV